MVFDKKISPLCSLAGKLSPIGLQYRGGLRAVSGTASAARARDAIHRRAKNKERQGHFAADVFRGTEHRHDLCRAQFAEKTFLPSAASGPQSFAQNECEIKATLRALLYKTRAQRTKSIEMKRMDDDGKY